MRATSRAHPVIIHGAGRSDQSKMHDPAIGARILYATTMGADRGQNSEEIEGSEMTTISVRVGYTEITGANVQF